MRKCMLSLVFVVLCVLPSHTGAYQQKEIAVTCRVVDSNSEPVEKVRIVFQDTTISYDQEIALDSFYTDKNGTFDQKIKVGNNASILIAILAKTDFKTVCTYNILLGETADFGEITMSEAVKVPITVIGRIVNKSGSPLENVSLLFTHSSMATSPSDVISSEQDGTFKYESEMDTSIIMDQMGVQVWPQVIYEVVMNNETVYTDTFEVNNETEFDIGDIVVEDNTAISFSQKTGFMNTSHPGSDVVMYSLDGKTVYKGDYTRDRYRLLKNHAHGVFIIKIVDRKNNTVCIIKTTSCKVK